MGVVCVCNQKENHNLLGLPYVDTYLEYQLEQTQVNHKEIACAQHLRDKQLVSCAWIVSPDESRFGCKTPRVEVRGVTFISHRPRPPLGRKS